MIDIFSYNGKGVLPTYSPGVSAYGQKGAPGNTGDNGSAVHFSSYDLSLPESIDTVKNLIRRGVSLSNNMNNSEEDNSIEYHDEDIILDITGNFYKVDITKDVINISKATNFGIYSQSPVSLKISNDSTGFQVRFETDFTENVSEADESMHRHLWRQKNPYFMDNVKTDDRTGNKVHDGYYSKYIYGNFLKYELSIDTANETNLMYKFHIEFPSGEVLDTVTDNHDVTVFIDNSYCFSCSDFASYFADIRTIGDWNEPSIIADIRDGNSNYTLDAEEIYEMSEFGPTSAQFAAITQLYIKDKCNVYVDVIDSDNGSIYRFDYKEARLSGSNAVIFRLPAYAVNDVNDVLSEDNYAQNLMTGYKIVIPEIELSKGIKGEPIEKNENNTVKRTSRNNTTGSKGSKRKKRK